MGCGSKMSCGLIVSGVFKERIKLGSVFVENLAYKHAGCSPNKLNTHLTHFLGISLEI